MKKYNNFKEYMEDVYYDEIFNRIKGLVFAHKDSFESDTVYSVSYVELYDIHVSGVTFKEQNDGLLEIRVSVDADISVKGKTRYGYDEIADNRAYNIFFSAKLESGLQQVRITNVEEYNPARFEKDKSLSQDLVPYLYEDAIEKNAEEFLSRHYPKALLQPMALPVFEVAQSMGMSVHYAPLGDTVFGKTYFGAEKVTVYADHTLKAKVEIMTQPGTMLINPNVYFMRNVGTANNTIIHECVHWDRHRKAFELQKLLTGDCNHISCEIVDTYEGIPDDAPSIKWMEWQANQLAPRILMPAKMTKRVYDKVLADLYTANPQRRYAELVQETVERVADYFQVSIFAAKLRLIELGYEKVQGTFVYTEGRYLPPFAFKKDAIGKNQTFVIDEQNALYVMFMDPVLRQFFFENKIVYANSMICINAPEYIETNEQGMLILTEYALEHVDECCFIFDRKFSASQNYSDTFYRRCFLCRDVVSDTFIEASYNPDHKDNQSRSERCKNLEQIASVSGDLSDIMGELPASFGGTLKYHMKRLDINEEELSDRCHLSVQTLSKYINDNSIDRKYANVVAVCKALCLHPVFFEDLLTKAGFDGKWSQATFFIKQLIWGHPDDSVEEWQRKINDAHINLQLPC